jgi:hypothetical protein
MNQSENRWEENVTTEFLIRKIASDVSPVKPLALPSFQLLRWLAISSAYASLGVAFIGFRQNISTEMARSSFLLEVLLPLSLAITSSASALALGIPGKKRVWHRAAPLTALLFCGIAFAYLIYSAPEAHPGAGIRCARNVLALSLAPAMFSFFYLRKAACMRPRGALLLSGFGASAFASAATRFICPNEDPLHFLIWHFLPVLLFGIGGYFLGKKFSFLKRPKGLGRN